MVLGQVILEAKEKEPGLLHQHAQSSDPEVHGSCSHEHQAPNEGVPCLVGIQNCQNQQSDTGRAEATNWTTAWTYVRAHTEHL